MAYIVRADIEAIFGVSNIDVWADLNNNDNAGEITARITAAITRAEAMVDDRLRGGPYTVPFTGTIPETIKDVTARLAGVWLYESRRIEDAEDDEVGRAPYHQKVAEKTLSDIAAGKIRLDVATRTLYPQIVEDSD